MILKAIQDDIIKQLADKQIDTSAYGGPSEVNNAGAWTLKQNVQNLKNLAREKLFTEQIEEYVFFFFYYELCKPQAVVNLISDFVLKTQKRGRCMD